MNETSVIYLDYNATTPIHPEVQKSILPYLSQYFGNPSSSYILGKQTKSGIENARKQVANLINCIPEEIIFTSCGTESNNYAIKGIAFENMKKGKHIITSSIEHPAVIEVCKYLEIKGFDITYLPVDQFGLISIRDIENSIRADTILITIMYANNEVGTIQPIKEISRLAKQRGIIFHTDAAQAVGKIPTDVEDLGVDLLTIVGHKFYGPKGVGALYIKRGVKLENFFHGANHEFNCRGGYFFKETKQSTKLVISRTENILGIVGLGKACELAKLDFEENVRHIKELKLLLKFQLESNFPSCRINGHPEFVLPNTLSVSFPGVKANEIIQTLESKLCISSGAACHSQEMKISSVLQAMKIDASLAMGTIRFSTGRFLTRNEVHQAVELLKEVIKIT